MDILLEGIQDLSNIQTEEKRLRKSEKNCLRQIESRL
jgi:hypothetical protein